jgi:hypothetical protein
MNNIYGLWSLPKEQLQDITDVLTSNMEGILHLECILNELISKRELGENVQREIDVVLEKIRKLK